jgi:hypothetical protein
LDNIAVRLQEEIEKQIEIITQQTAARQVGGGRENSTNGGNTAKAAPVHQNIKHQ